jgi:probable addiction module antidote protein
MSRSRSYKELLHIRLQSPDEAAAYLNAALEDEDTGVFLVALRDIAEANGGMAYLAKEAHLNRETLYRTLSRKGNPTLTNLRCLLGTIGLEIAINANPKNSRIYRE